MGVHHVDQRRARPVRVRLAQKIGDVFGVAVPLRVSLLLTGLVAGFRG
jgi:hypothetical protein